METRKGWDVDEVLKAILAVVVGILSGFLLHEYLRKKKKRGGSKRQVKKR
jgi:hypothetical protein